MESARRREELPGRDPPTDEQIDATVRLLSLLADETRLRILCALSVGDFDVKTLVTITGSTTTATSQHLARLRDAELVSVRRDGRRAIYRLGGGHLRKLIREALSEADRHILGLPPHE